MLDDEYVYFQCDTGSISCSLGSTFGRCRESLSELHGFETVHLMHGERNMRRQDSDKANA